MLFRSPRADIGKKHNHKGIRRRVIWGGESEIPVWKFGIIKRAGSHMEFPEAGHYCPVDNRSGVYRMLRNNKRHSMDAPVFRRGVGAYTNPDLIYRQRSSHEDDENPGVPSTEPAYRAQTPFYPRDGRSEISNYQRDPRERESCRPFDEIVTNDGTEEMDERDFQRLMNEWLEE